MSEQKQELTCINWASCFDFVHVFRAFKMAIDPSMLVLGLMGMIITYAAGALLSTMAGHWGAAHSPGVAKSILLVLATLLIAAAGVVRIVRSNHLPSGIVLLAVAGIVGLYTILAWTGGRPHEPVSLWVDAQMARGGRTGWWNTATPPGTGAAADVDVFREFRGFTVDRLHAMAASLWTLRNPLAGFGDSARPGGAVYQLCALVVGVVWLFLYHPLFAIVFTLACVIIWGLVGGAMCRIAALKATRGEKIPMREALDFAKLKFVGFAAAPLIPAICLAFIALALAAGGLVAMVPFLDFLSSLLLSVAIVAGFVMALLVIGAIGGSFLLYPTVAVEASDAFDAISRSYAYFYQKPWRTGLYALAAGIYGAICFLFVRTIVWLALKLTHTALSMGSFGERTDAYGQATDKIGALWPAPTFAQLTPDLETFQAVLANVGYFEWLTAVIIYLTLLVVALLLASYVISYFFSASTVIYLLLRHHADATDMEEVTLDEDLEDDEPAYEPPAAPPSTDSAAPAAEPAAPPEAAPGQPT